AQGINVDHGYMGGQGFNNTGSIGNDGTSISNNTGGSVITPGNTSESTSSAVSNVIPSQSLGSKFASAGKNFANLALPIIAWPFAKSVTFGGGSANVLNLILLVVILVVLYFWYREYRNNKKIDHINKEI